MSWLYINVRLYKLSTEEVTLLLNLTDLSLTVEWVIPAEVVSDLTPEKGRISGTAYKLLCKESSLIMMI